MSKLILQVIVGAAAIVLVWVFLVGFVEFMRATVDALALYNGSI